ncbi:hypothetical protein Hanom_Chr05g00413921 [Helianthus anomalus]
MIGMMVKRYIRGCWMRLKETFGLRDLNNFGKKRESLYHLKGRYYDLLSRLRCYSVRNSNAEEISKFADVLPLEWNEDLIELKKDYNFSTFTLNDFVNKLQEHGPQIVCSSCEKIKI